MVKRSWLQRSVALLVVALLAASCGDDGDNDGGAASPGEGTEAPSTTDAGEPQRGGVATFGSFLRLAGFDPTMVNSTYGCCGGIELTAFYDVLLTIDPETGEFVGRVAESFEPNADYTSWTLKLRDGVKFADGTAYDAEAVKFNIERHLAPTSRSASRAMLTRFLDTTTVVDPLTLDIHLKEAWTGFPTLLAREVGMVASPTAVQAAGENFAISPGKAGAGPFLLTSFKPDESIDFERNPDYYGGEVYLDGLKFVALGPEATSYESFKAGQLDAVFLRNPEVIANAEADGAETIMAGSDPMGTGLILNSGVTVTCTGGSPELHCAGQPDGTKVTTEPPTADPRVRQAIAHAIDPAVLNERVFNGKANATSEIFPEGVPWSPGVPGPEYDLDEAKRLVDEAKAGGWDGKLRVRTPNTTSAYGLAVETMLELAGMDVELNVNEDVAAGVAAVLTRRDWDVASWSLGFNDDINNVFAQLSVSFQGDPTRYGYGNSELDAGLDALRVADDADSREAAITDISTVLSRDVPFISTSLGENRVVLADHLHGVVLDAQARLQFDKAWIAK